MSVFNGQRPKLGQEVALLRKRHRKWVVGAIAPGIVIAHRKGIEQPRSSGDFIVIRESFD